MIEFADLHLDYPVRTQTQTVIDNLSINQRGGILK